MNKNLFFTLFGLCLIYIGGYMYLSIQRNIERMKVENVILQRRVDSLRNEMFIYEVNVARYEYMMSIVEQENPVLYQKVMHESE